MKKPSKDRKPIDPVVRATQVVNSICSDPHWAYRDAFIERIAYEIRTAQYVADKDKVS